MSKIISIQLEYVFNAHWAAAVHRNESTRIYNYVTESSWTRIQDLSTSSKTLSVTLDGDRYQFNFT